MKHILLAVTGLSPQVITETIYAMHLQQQFVDEIHIITTSEGKKRAKLGLLTDQHLAQLLNDYCLPPIVFSEAHIHCIENAGVAVNDAVSDTDHDTIANFITEHVRAFTSDSNVMISALIAGGRKTMTFYLGYAMSLFGRECDAIIHTLVTPGYENLHDFYYPSKHSKTLFNSKTGQVLDAKDAVVSLASIPFVRMRKEMPERLLHNPDSDFSSTVKNLNLQKEKLCITLKLGTNQIIVNNNACQLSPNDMAMYCWFAYSKVVHKEGLQNPLKMTHKDALVYSKHYLHWAKRAGCDNKVFQSLGVSHREDFNEYPKEYQLKAMDNKKFESRTTVNKKLKEHYGHYLAELIGIHKLTPNGVNPKRFGIMLVAEQIKFKYPITGAK
jgi:CRISPR-associated protein (TIGR02584 family)